jgi:hypothetical protein
MFGPWFGDFNPVPASCNTHSQVQKLQDQIVDLEAEIEELREALGSIYDYTTQFVQYGWPQIPEMHKVRDMANV